MKMCQAHWDALREGVKTRGMWHLVAKSGEVATEQMRAQLEHRDEPSDFDPLMAANWALFSAALECGGLDMVTGEHCPLCEADLHGGHAQEWINGCLDAQLAHARELKLVPGIQ